MKPTSPLCISIALAGGALLAISSASAATLYWDGGIADILTNGNGASAGAAGTWDTTLLNWDAGASPHVAWNNTNNDTAVFAGTAGTVTLGTPITAGGLTFNTTGYTITGSTLTLAGTPVMSAGSSITATISSDIAGSNGLEKTGAGTLIFSGTNNTYSGTTTITAGTLRGSVTGTSLNPVSPFGTSTILLNGGTLDLVASGSINSTAETVNFGNNVTVGGNATINAARPGSTESNKTMGLGTLTIGANTLTATAPNIGYSTGFSAVTLTGNATFSPGSNATLVLGNITQSGGNYSLTKTGVGTLRLTGTNDYAGGTILNGGTLSVNSDAALGAAGTGITVSGNTTLSSAATAITEYTRAISLGAGTTLTLTHAGANTASFSGVISGSGNLTATLGISGSTIALTNTANTFTGNVLVSNPNNGNLRLSFNSLGDAGMLSLGKNSYTVYAQYTGASNLVFNNRRIDLNSSFGSVNDGGGNPINMFENNGSGTIAFKADMTVAAGKTGTFFFGGTNTGDNTYAGVIPNSSGGTLSIGKHGAGKWVLSNNNTFSGGVEVRGGTLVLSGTNSYTGQTDVQAGTLVIGSIADYGTDSAIGKGTSGVGIILGNSTNTGTLNYTGGAQLTDRFIRVGINSSNSGGSTILNNGTGVLTFTAANFNEAYTNANSQTRSITLGGTNDGTIQGGIQNSSGTSLVSVVKIGAGTWTLQGTNAFTGSTTLNAGTLKLNYDTGTSGTNTSKLADTNGILALNGGTLELYGGSHVEAVTSTTLNNGTTFIKQTGGGSSTLSMGVITYTGGALDFSAAGIANVSTSTVTNGILSSAGGTARVTVGGADWAAKDVSNNVIAYTGYTTGYAGGAMTANTNYSMVGGTIITTNRGATTNTLKITTSAASQSIPISTGATFTLGSLLFAGADDYTISTTGTGRIATSLLHNYGAGTLTLGSLGAALTQYGTGKTLLNAAAGGDYGMNIFGGTVQFSNNLQIGTNATVKAIALNNGTLVADTSGGNIALDSSGSLSRTVSLGAGGGTLDVIGGNKLTASGVISDTAGQFPTLTIGSASSNGTVELTATNTYTGRTVISGGTLSVGTIGNGGVAGNLGQANNLPTNIVFNGGTLLYTGANATSDRAFTINAGKTAAINTANNISFAGATGTATTGALTKTGAGTLTLTGTNTYTGATTVSNGTLVVNGSIATSSLTTVASGATIGGSGTTGALTISSGGFITPGNSPGILNTGNFTQAGLFNAEITGLTPGTQHDQISVTGTVDLTGGSLITLFSAGTYSVNDLIFPLLNDGTDAITGTYTGLDQGDTVTSYGGFNWTISYTANNTGVGTGTFTGGNDIALQATPVPEPSTILLGSLGLLALLRRRR